MKNFVLTTTLLCAFVSLHAQQWLDKKYTYDSTLNVTYGTAVNFNGRTESLKMDIYSPICSDQQVTSRRPLLVFMHGGAFLAGNKNDPSIVNLCKQFAKRGYVTATIDYRLGFISDDIAWNCNYPNYSCVFATDSTEWYRSLFRGIQDAKGAVRYLVNRHQQFRIDTSHIFVAGESAGGFLALGTALMDTTAEKFPQAFAIANAPKPHTNTANCVYNVQETFSQTTIVRPDLGSFEGTIEPTNINFTIKGIGNIYGAMANDLLKLSKAGKPKPAIYSFHQPCDIVVPIDSGNVYAGLSWCMTNGYNCFAISNTPKVYGSRAFANWNTSRGYGYNIKSEYTTTNFPFNFLFGTGSCADQVNNPCHAYDNTVLRENNMASFFANLITITPFCLPKASSLEENALLKHIKTYPNPFSNHFEIDYQGVEAANYSLFDVLGRLIQTGSLSNGKQTIKLGNAAVKGVYCLKITSNGHSETTLIEHL